MELSLEYVAGFFDGEGSIGVYSSLSNTKGKRRYRSWILTVNVAQVETQILHAFKARWGGTLWLNPRSQKTGGTRRDCWYWRCSGRVAEKFLREIRPYTIIKSAQIDLALEFMESRIAPGQNWGDREDPGPIFSQLLKDLKRGASASH